MKTVSILAGVAMLTGVGFAQAGEVLLTEAQMDSVTAGVLREKFVEAGSWRTLETFWNVKTTGFFRSPAEVEIKVRYGVGFLGKDSQKQTLDGETIKRLSVGKGSVVGARMQARTQHDVYLTYDIEPGNVAVMPPKINLPKDVL